jgi:hypothetical protein
MFLSTLWALFWVIWTTYYVNVETKISKWVKLFKNIYSKFTDKNERKFKPKFVYLKSPALDKQFYIWKKPFIESKVEKIWM